MRLLYISFAALVLFPSNHDASSILIVSPFFGNAHRTIMETLSLELNRRGHEITIITRHMLDDPPDKYKQIKVVKNEALENMDASNVPNLWQVEQIRLMWTTTLPAVEFLLNSPAVKDFIKNDNSHFDLVICEEFYQEYSYMFSHKYRAPLVLVDTTTFFSHIGGFMGNSMPLSYVTHEVFRMDNIDTLYGKLVNAMLTVFDRLGRRFYYLPKVDRLISKHFPNLPGPLPTVEDLQNNVSLVLINSHYSYDPVVPLVPGVVQIGGIHIKPPGALPKDLKTFLDDAKEGAIYFALGSHWKVKYLGENRTNAFVEVFKGLKQRVVWKTDVDIPKMDNVFTGSWLPQNDILAHPNVKVFISHGGMLSTQEAVHHGVPVLGIPLFWDQYTNVYKLKKLGAALRLDYLTMKREDISNALEEILNDSKYSDSIKTISSRFRDRQNEPKETAMFWLEYVIRHGGTPFLKSPMANMSFLDYYSIELFALSFALAVILLLGVLLRWMWAKRNVAQVTIDKKIN